MPARTGKKIDRSAHIGDSAIALVHGRVNEMDFVWHERKIDAGIDGSIELRDPSTGQVNNRHFLVQSKGSDNRFPGENDRGFHYLCRPEDVDYWMDSPIPVLLVCSHPATGEAWWAHVQGWFSDPGRRASGRVDFDKATQRFGAVCASRLLALADPHGDAYVPVPAQKPETLTSNLLAVTVPTTLYRSPAPGRSPTDVFAAQGDAGAPLRFDWLVRGGLLYTWQPTEGTPLGLACAGPSEPVATAELAGSGDDGHRLVVELLNSTFRHDQRLDCDWTQDRKTIYFKATPRLQDRKILGGTGRPRLVFHAKRTKDGSRVRYYKHAALSWQFLFADGRWWCALDATHHYTRDGYRESDYSGDLRAGLKKLNKNRGVFGDVKMWAAWLQGEEDLLGPRETVLGYGGLLSFDVEVGIDDKDWLVDHRPGAPQPDEDYDPPDDDPLRLFE